MQAHALVTGATAGIGREFALQLAALGYDLTLVARDRARLTELATELQASRGVAVTPLPADLSSDDDTSRIVEYLAAHPVDLLVNNAGFGHAGRVGVMSHEMQDAMIRLHVLAVHRLTQAALPAMLERKAGSVIIVSSVASYLTSPGNVNYCATKAYDRTFAEGLALETARHGIYVGPLSRLHAHRAARAREGGQGTHAGVALDDGGSRGRSVIECDASQATNGRNSGAAVFVDRSRGALRAARVHPTHHRTLPARSLGAYGTISTPPCMIP